MIERGFVRGMAFAAALGLASFGGSLYFAKNKAVNFIAVLTPGQAQPFAANSNTFGVSYLYLDKDNELCFSLSYVEPNSNETASHIHGPGIPGGANGTVIWDLSDQPGSPRKRCVGPLTAKQIKELRAGLYYFVVHTEEYARGEMRGQIVSAAQ